MPGLFQKRRPLPVFPGGQSGGHSRSIGEQGAQAGPKNKTDLTEIVAATHREHEITPPSGAA